MGGAGAPCPALAALGNGHGAGTGAAGAALGRQKRRSACGRGRRGAGPGTAIPERRDIGEGQRLSGASLFRRSQDFSFAGQAAPMPERTPFRGAGLARPAPPRARTVARARNPSGQDGSRIGGGAGLCAVCGSVRPWGARVRPCAKKCPTARGKRVFLRVDFYYINKKHFVTRNFFSIPLWDCCDFVDSGTAGMLDVGHADGARQETASNRTNRGDAWTRTRRWKIFA